MPNRFHTKPSQKKKAFQANRRLKHSKNIIFGNNVTLDLGNLQLHPPQLQAANQQSLQQQQQQKQLTVHNFTDYKLSQQEIQLLNLGTTFVIPPVFNRNQFKKDISNFKRKIRLKYYYSAQHAEEFQQGPGATVALNIYSLCLLNSIPCAT